MTLGEKIRYLREVEGSLRGLDRPLTQQELMKGIADGDGEEDQPVVSFADREREASAYDAVVAHVAGEVFQGASGISGG